jgi:hypothetical protein
MHNTTIAFAQVSRWRLLRLIWPFLAIVVLLLALGTASLQMIRGVRAYISFESVWSNAQKAAVEALEQYAQTRNEDHFDRYLEESAVLAGARAARIELEKPFPDFRAARSELTRARNHAADIGGMIDLSWPKACACGRKPMRCSRASTPPPARCTRPSRAAVPRVTFNHGSSRCARSIAS